jgi:putative PIN family toxin of toxin-antitoxin system
MKIVIDTNCLLPAIFDNSPYIWLWQAFCESKFSQCCSTEMLEEYGELLARFYSVEISESVINTITNASNFIAVIPYFNWNLIEADPEDNKFADCALNAGVDYIVTNDKHFNILKDMDFPYVKVVDIEKFKRILAQ